MHVWFYDFVLIRSQRTWRLWCKVVTCLIVCFSQLKELNPQQDTGDIWEQLAGLSELCASLHRRHRANIQWSAVQEVVWGQLMLKRWDWRSFISAVRSFILRARVQSPYLSGAIGGTPCWAGGMQSSWFSVCAYFVKFYEAVLFLGSGQDHLCWVQFHFNIRSSPAWVSAVTKDNSWGLSVDMFYIAEWSR